MSSPTSPYVFKTDNEEDKKYITKTSENKYAFFLRKIHPSFPNEVIEQIIFPFERTKYTERELSKMFYRAKYNWWPVIIFLFLAFSGIMNVFNISI
jgi:hypothetical protein